MTFHYKSTKLRKHHTKDREREREREEKGTHVCKEVKGQEEGRSAAGSPNGVQPADIGWPTGNGKELNNSQACCLAQLCLAAA